MRIECPHCFVRVIPSEDRCPSCQGNVNDPTEHIGVFVSKETEFPKRCHLCDLPTDQTKKISGSDRTTHWAEGREDPYAGLGLLLLPLKILFALIFGFFSLIFAMIVWVITSSSKSNTAGGEVVNFYKIAIKVPTCEECKPMKIEPIEVRGLEGQMKIVVHQQFAHRLNESATTSQ